MSVSGQSQVSLRLVSGKSLVSLWSVSGQSQVSLRSVSGLSQVSVRSVSGLEALLTHFVRSEPKILRLVGFESAKNKFTYSHHISDHNQFSHVIMFEV